MSLLDRIGQMWGQESEAPLDLTQFDDPLAERISWDPLQYGGSSFRTHRLERTDLYLLRIVPTPWMYLFSAVFILVPAVGGLVGLFLTDDPVAMVISCAVILAFGFFLLSNARQVAVFNQRSRMCTGRFRSRGHWLPQLRDVPFIEIHAIQLLRERVRSKNSRYFSYELNLVLRNGERLALMDHSKQDAIREDAQLLSRTLSVPLWDATRKRRNRG